jgi:hypothetical protein
MKMKRKEGGQEDRFYLEIFNNILVAYVGNEDYAH